MASGTLAKIAGLSFSSRVREIRCVPSYIAVPISGFQEKGRVPCRPSGQGALPLSLLELHSAAVVRPHGQPELAYLGKVIGHVGFPVSRV